MPIGHLIVLADGLEKHALLQQIRMAESIGAALTKEGQKSMQERIDRVFGRSFGHSEMQRRDRKQAPIVMQDGLTVVDELPVQYEDRELFTGRSSGYKPIHSPVAQPLSPEEERTLKSMGLLHTKEPADKSTKDTKEH